MLLLLYYFQELQTQVSSNEDFINEQMIVGTSLVAGDKLKIVEDKEKVQNDLTNFTQKRSTLQINLLNAQKL